ncbi:MAG: aminopeptidase P family protein [Actinomycetia bacterium]|nr:aminopeptidase P family protein [Actinomycetes bacterium]MCP3911778.1 aminopeptidase P family protein [Actinomycetes bacterium]MCP4086788.1 aminopeptidase P family protein [Actinomycetes bacterium]
MAMGGRIDSVRADLDTRELDALLVTDLSNIRWLTGFAGSNATVVVRPEALVLLTDGRYADQAPAQAAALGVDLEVVVSAGPDKDHLLSALGSATTAGLEADSITWARQRTLADWFDDLELVPTSGVISAFRQVKDEGELARLEAAAAIADAALAEVIGRLADGPTEGEFARELETAMLGRGASAPSFETIVAAGPNGALPHARPSNRVIGSGELVVLDFGALVDGYHSDMTRTVGVGELDDQSIRMLEVVEAAQAAGRATVGAGVRANEVDKACRDIITDAGWAEAFPHGTGHGVGLDIHEAPSVGARSESELVAGNVVTVEPGVYLAGHGGVRIEDTVVVTADGCRSITHSPRRPVVG